MNVVDPSAPRTWPPAALKFAQAEADRLVGSTPFAHDLEVVAEAEQHFRELMGDAVIGYHATRLLDDEVVAIRRGGLRKLTSHLVEERIEKALLCGALTDADAARCRRRRWAMRSTAKTRSASCSAGSV